MITLFLPTTGKIISNFKTLRFGLRIKQTYKIMINHCTVFGFYQEGTETTPADSHITDMLHGRITLDWKPLSSWDVQNNLHVGSTSKKELQKQQNLSLDSQTARFDAFY